MTDKDGRDPSAKPRQDKKARSRKIGKQLRTLYDQIASEPIPDEFISLLESAGDRAESEKAGPDD